LRLDMRKWVQIMVDLDLLPELFGQVHRPLVLHAILFLVFFVQRNSTPGCFV
jgi:hypothetical protein